LRDTTGKHRIIVCPSNNKMLKEQDGADRIFSVLYVEKKRSKKKSRKTNNPMECMAFDINQAAGTFKVKVPIGIKVGEKLICKFGRDSSTQFIYQDHQQTKDVICLCEIMIRNIHKKLQTFCMRLPKDWDMLQVEALYFDEKRDVVNVKVPQNIQEGDKFRVLTDKGSAYCIVDCPSEKRLQYASNRTLELRISKDLKDRGTYKDIGLIDLLLPSVKTFDIDVEQVGMLKCKIPENLWEGDEMRLLMPDGKVNIFSCPTDSEMKWCKGRVVEMIYSKTKGVVTAFDVDVVKKMFKINLPEGIQQGQKFVIQFKGLKDLVPRQRLCPWKCPPDDTFEQHVQKGETKRAQDEGTKTSQQQQRTIVISLDELETVWKKHLENELKEDAKLDKELADVPLSSRRSCTNCDKIEDLPGTLKECTCKAAAYCPGKTCQKAHWKQHKKMHKKMSTPEAIANRNIEDDAKEKADKEKDKEKEQALEFEEKRFKEKATMEVQKNIQILVENEKIAMKRQEGRNKRIEKALACKLKGNDFFKKKKYSDAATQYTYGTNHLWDYDLSDPKKVKDLRVACLSNYAQCLMSLKQFEKYETVVKRCDSALEINPSHGKTLYRRGIVLMHLNRDKEAEHDLHRTLTLDPTNSNVQKQLAKLKNKTKQKSSAAPPHQ
jgi:hypothetical protein